MALSLSDLLHDHGLSAQASILDTGLVSNEHCQIDLSRSAARCIPYDLSKPVECQAYIDSIFQKSKAKVGYGGYLEDRIIYDFPQFHEEGEPIRSIHLGMDFWSDSGTNVYVPFAGVLHSFKDNKDPGNYGPTIILAHTTQETSWYSLYGHLSADSLKNLKTGQYMPAGSVLGQIGDVIENGGYAPHLHFQLIQDLQGMKGDYPGVCAPKDLDFYQKNCPDPNLLLQI
ncbi:MAG: peptidoglycan DD-metalloendopeptidase family protein [Bacteroidia bacterium]|nr:peptidoglycan DD-metalloendopeptidase family protein [Bacteroidia bacterium]